MTRFSQTSRTIEEKGSGKKILGFWRSLLLAVLAVCFVFLTVIYLIEVNYIASRGLQIRELEQRIAYAKEENEKTESQMVEMNSMADLSNKIEALKMVPIDNITYFDTAGQVMARR